MLKSKSAYVINLSAVRRSSMEKKHKRGSFTGSIGFVLASAASAVGLGNIWRFPYLAAKDGGGLFLLCYIVLALTFGFTLMISEVALGRKTHQGPLTAYKHLHPKWGWIGTFSCLVPCIILPYYCVIGGWVLKYLAAYSTLQGASAVADGYFTGFITAQWAPILWFIVFLVLTTLIVFMGVDAGIERVSKILMPILIVLIIGISIFSLCLRHTDTNGITRTGLQGFKIYVIPNFQGMTLRRFFIVLMDAMGQLFYSISVAMGIMVAYGSYAKDDINLIQSSNRIEFFDSLVAFLAGLMIIPAVFTFMGTEGMSAGPSLMFISLPKVFDAMGAIGTVVGIVFFVMVAFAAVTSSVSIMEAIVASFVDKLHISRKSATTMVAVGTLIVGIIVCLGYNIFYFDMPLPNGAVGQILDVMDYISNNVFMPFVAVATCVLIGWVIKPQSIIDEVTRNGEHFGRKKMYVLMVRYIVPVLLFFLFLQSVGVIRL